MERSGAQICAHTHTHTHERGRALIWGCETNAHPWKNYGTSLFSSKTIIKWFKEIWEGPVSKDVFTSELYADEMPVYQNNTIDGWRNWPVSPSQ